MSRFVDAAADLIAGERLGALVTVVAGPGTGARAVIAAGEGIVAGDLPADLAEAVLTEAGPMMDRERNGTVAVGEHRVFIETLAPRPRLVIFGAVDIGRFLCRFATEAGFRVIVTDARPAFCTPERFPEAEAVVVGWPEDVAGDLSIDARTYVVALSHSARLEDPAMHAALRAGARYVGAMGSRGTHDKRRTRLTDAGFSTDDIDRIHSPIGIGIGAEAPAEVAVSILAELIAARHGADGVALTHSSGPIHPQRAG